MAWDDKGLLAGAGLANPGGVLSVGVALAVGCEPRQALGADPPFPLLSPTMVPPGQTPNEQQTHPTALAIDSRKVAGGGNRG